MRKRMAVAKSTAAPFVGGRVEGWRRAPLLRCNTRGDEVCTLVKDDGDIGKNQREFDGHPAKNTLIHFGGKAPTASLPYAILARYTPRLFRDFFHLRIARKAF
jgi:hypothetical protein